MSGDHMMQEEGVSVFVVRCPLGDQCSKKGGILAKKLDEASARAALKHHLEKSPYHELSEEEATKLSEGADVEVYTEDASSWAKWQEDQTDWTASRKRKAADDGRGAIVGCTRVPRPTMAPIGAPSSGSSGVIMMRHARTKAEASIAVNGPQLVACIDSLKRSRTAAESAANLAAKASRAFNEESIVIRQCEEVLRSYLE